VVPEMGGNLVPFRFGARSRKRSGFRVFGIPPRIDHWRDLR